MIYANGFFKLHVSIVSKIGRVNLGQLDGGKHSSKLPPILSKRAIIDDFVTACLAGMYWLGADFVYESEIKPLLPSVR